MQRRVACLSPICTLQFWRSSTDALSRGQYLKPPPSANRRARRTDLKTTAVHVANSVDAFRRILRELRVIARRSELATGLSAAQVFVLYATLDRPDCSVTDLAVATMTDRSSVSVIVDRLVEHGYVSRTTDPRDRRRAVLSITQRGLRAMRAAAPPPTAILIAALRRLSSTELQSLDAGLAALTGTMGLEREPAGMLFDESARPRRNRSTSLS